MAYCLTFVAPQHYPDFEMICKTVMEESGISYLDISTLSPNKAIDIIIEEDNTNRLDLLRKKIKSDILIQKHCPETRRKKLLLSDMDATIVAEETLDELAGSIGIKQDIADITDATMRGEIDFETSIIKRVKMLKGLELSALQETAKHLTYNTGAKTLIKTLNTHNVHTVLVSGGFTFFTKYVAQEIDFKENFGNNLGQDDTQLDGKIIPPILGKEAKATILKDKIKEFSLTANQTCCIGDGANDLAMLEYTQSNDGFGVGYYPKPLCREKIDNIIIYGDLTTLLYAQGYKEEEIIHAT
jgi:phosphoserine phosphatase